MMNKKQKKLEGKLGSWADQANLGRVQPQPHAEQPAPTPAKSVRSAKAKASKAPKAQVQAERATHPVARSLMDRIADTASAHDMDTNQVIGELLTWALDQVDAGKHQLNQTISRGE